VVGRSGAAGPPRGADGGGGSDPPRSASEFTMPRFPTARESKLSEGGGRPGSPAIRAPPGTSGPRPGTSGGANRPDGRTGSGGRTGLGGATGSGGLTGLGGASVLQATMAAGFDHHAMAAGRRRLRTYTYTYCRCAVRRVSAGPAPGRGRRGRAGTGR
jgi:hypothetical protein